MGSDAAGGALGVGIAQDAALEQAALFMLVEFVMGLDERDDPAAGRKPAQGSWDGESLRRPAEVDGDEIDRVVRRACVQGVGPLQQRHARVVPEFPRELPVGGVDRDHAGGPVVEQAVGESAGAAPEVGASQTVDVDLKRVQGVFEFEPAAADVAGFVSRSHGVVSVG